MTAPKSEEPPLSNLAQRRRSALERMAAEAAKTSSMVDNARRTADAARRASEHVNVIDTKGFAAVDESLRRMQNIAARASNFGGPSAAEYLAELNADNDRAMAELDATARAVAAERAGEHRATVEREEAMVDTLQGIRDVLFEQQQHAIYNDRLQRAIFAVSVLGFIGAIVIGVAALSDSWRVVVAGGVGGLVLTSLVLWSTGLLRRSTAEGAGSRVSPTSETPV